MSAGEFFELIRPAAFIVSAILSIFVFVSARRRFPLYQALLWALGTMLLPLVFIPVYLALLIIQPKRFARYLPPTTRRMLIETAIYATILLSTLAVYLYTDSHTADTHIARATEAKVSNDTKSAIREYQHALAEQDDAHTHKLLAAELANSGYWAEAISEYRLAEQGGEPDDVIHYQLGLLLDKMNLDGQAKLEFREFVFSEMCARPKLGDYRCEDAKRRLE